MRCKQLRFTLDAHGLAVLSAPLLLLSLATAPAEARETAPGTQPAATASAAVTAGFCAVADYYAIPLVSTKRVPGTANTEGRVDVAFGSTPFGVSVTPDGSYEYELTIRIDDLPERPNARYVAWITTSSLDRVEQLGVVEDGYLEGRARWNKFLIVVTLEPESAVAAAEDNGADNGTDSGARSSAGGGIPWSGPVVVRGVSRSGAMHTMAGHGPFQQENCASYGYS